MTFPHFSDLWTSNATVYLQNRETQRFITYYDIINPQIEYKRKIKMKILTKLRRLEEEVLKLKGKRREEIMEKYRELLRLLKDEPIYLVRYE